MALARPLRRIHAHIPLALLALVLSRPAPAANAAGTALVVAGMGLRVWAAGVLRKRQGLCTEGPYRYVRHPLYLGSIVAAVGFCVMMNVIWGWVAVFPVFLVIYAAQVSAEERYLRHEYGDLHAEWARRVPMLLPRLRRHRAEEIVPWRLSQALANREQYHVAVSLLLACLFYLKAYWGR